MSGEIKADRSGSRTVELFIPYTELGIEIKEITIGPCVLDHTMRWKEAKFKNWFEMMVEISIINGRPATDALIRQLRYPDADRVIQNFIEILPEDIKNAMVDGTWPKRVGDSDNAAEDVQRAVADLASSLDDMDTPPRPLPANPVQQPPLDNLNLDD